MQQKTILGAIIVVVLIAGGFVVWKLQVDIRGTATATAVTNSGWKLYQDSSSGLSFEYPQSFAVTKQDRTGSYSIYVTDPQTRALYLSVMVVNDPSQPGVSKMFTGPYPKKIPPTGNSSTITIKQRTFNGLKGIEYYGYQSEGHSYSDAFMYKNNHLWEVSFDPVLEGRITYYPQPGIPLPDKDTYEKILASIKISP
ncbi:MAG TPA: hypothetical protein ENJ75_01330 [Candidatus Kaiserbacteria bacterium]|nr:hypothetical protein [Candidatus Kaiserbacteria bacterium]